MREHQEEMAENFALFCCNLPLQVVVHLCQVLVVASELVRLQFLLLNGLLKLLTLILEAVSALGRQMRGRLLQKIEIQLVGVGCHFSKLR